MQKAELPERSARSARTKEVGVSIGSHQAVERRTKNSESGTVRQEALRPTRWLFVALALLAFAAPANSADETGQDTQTSQNPESWTGDVIVPAAPVKHYSPTLLFDTPTADVLPAGSFAISADVTGPLVKTPKNTGWWEGDVNVRFSPVKHLDFAVTAYTFKDYVLDAKYQILGGEPDRFGLAVGVYDVGLNSYVSPIGHGLEDAWPDWKYNEYLPRYNRTTENFSAFVVTCIPVMDIARLHLGLGRGRFVGYDSRSKYLNTDILFNEYHQWALALFGGAEVFVTPNVALVAEASSRDMNTGVKANFGPITAAVAWTKMEGLVFAKGDDRFGRIEFGATYRLGPWTRQREAPPQPEPPPSELEPEQPPIVQKLGLYAIWFNWDKSDITEVAAGTLRRNAEVILSHPEIKTVILSGYASEEGTLEHNLPLSGRRANAAFEYLKTLGVPAEKMLTQAKGEMAGRPLPLRRAVFFEIVLGE